MFLEMFLSKVTQFIFINCPPGSNSSETFYSSMPKRTYNYVPQVNKAKVFIHKEKKVSNIDISKIYSKKFGDSTRPYS